MNALALPIAIISLFIFLLLLDECIGISHSHYCPFHHSHLTSDGCIGIIHCHCCLSHLLLETRWIHWRFSISIPVLHISFSRLDGCIGIPIAIISLHISCSCLTLDEFIDIYHCHCCLSHLLVEISLDIIIINVGLHISFLQLDEGIGILHSHSCPFHLYYLHHSHTSSVIVLMWEV